jgi:hypothetical protein
MTAGATCFFPACYPSPAGMVTMRSRQLLFFAGRDEGAGDLIVLEGEDTGDLFPNFQTRFKYAMEMTFGKSALSFNSSLETMFG